MIVQTLLSLVVASNSVFLSAGHGVMVAPAGYVQSRSDDPYRGSGPLPSLLHLRAGARLERLELSISGELAGAGLGPTHPFLMLEAGPELLSGGSFSVVARGRAGVHVLSPEVSLGVVTAAPGYPDVVLPALGVEVEPGWRFGRRFSLGLPVGFIADVGRRGVDTSDGPAWSVGGWTLLARIRATWAVALWG